MSRNKNVNYTQYIHEYTDDNGITRYAVAEWNQTTGQFTAPLDKRTRELTGCSEEFAGSAKGIGGYKDRKQALRRARYLFGPDTNEEF